jgi:hypothetical protein
MEKRERCYSFILSRTPHENIQHVISRQCHFPCRICFELCFHIYYLYVAYEYKPKNFLNSTLFYIFCCHSSSVINQSPRLWRWPRSIRSVQCLTDVRFSNIVQITATESRRASLQIFPWAYPPSEFPVDTGTFFPFILRNAFSIIAKLILWALKVSSKNAWLVAVPLGYLIYFINLIMSWYLLLRPNRIIKIIKKFYEENIILLSVNVQ